MVDIINKSIQIMLHVASSDLTILVFSITLPVIAAKFINRIMF